MSGSVCLLWFQQRGRWTSDQLSAVWWWWWDQLIMSCCSNWSRYLYASFLLLDDVQLQ